MIRALGAAALALAAALSASGPAPALSRAPDRVSIEWRSATASAFRPGMLISDDRFFDAGAMDAGAIQSFLERRPCVPLDAPCLAAFRGDAAAMPDQGPGHCAAYPGGRNRRAADILAGVARACGINPQVLLVLLQKEQSLVTRPTARGYVRAAGYACPNTAGCDTRYAGFANQVYRAAWQFRQYTLHPAGRPVVVGTVDIAYSPDASCGSAPVDVRNQATANLYLYTPYQPNAAAVADLYGNGDACSAYGNRNFWRIFTDWFGDPTAVRLDRLGARAG